MKFPRSRRITRRADFERVRRHGGSVKGRFLVLGHLEESECSTPFRIGIITTRKIGGAVIRNRIRRRIRGIVQRVGDRIRPGSLLVIIARRGAAGASSEKLEKEFKWMLHRASLMLPKED